MKNLRTIFPVLIILAISVLLTAACGGAPSRPAVSEVPAAIEEAQDEHHMEDEHMEEHEGEAEHTHEDDSAHDHSSEEHEASHDHSVPEEAAVVPNPVEVDAASIEAGARLYAVNCASCHGETGKGDGPAAEALEKKPSDLHEDHVQINSDGALFYIITHGQPGTPMPAWEDVLSEEERWHVVNFLRTFGEK